MKPVDVPAPPPASDPAPGLAELQEAARAFEAAFAQVRLASLRATAHGTPFVHDADRGAAH